MSKIEELIAQLCPDGAEYMELGDVFEFKYGTGNTIPTIGGEYPVYGSNGIVGTHNEYNSEDAPVIGHIGAYAGIVNWGYGKHFVTYNGVICKVKSKLVIPTYAYYQLLKQDFISMAHSGSQPFVSYGMLNKVQIPIPPIPIQHEIVNILDKFVKLQAELQAELQARRNQYEYYQSSLFYFEESVKCIELREIADFSQGIQVDVSKQSPDKKDGFVRFLRIVDFVKDNEPPRYIKNPGSRFVKNEGDLVMIRYGSSAAGKVFLMYSGAIANNMFQIKLKTEDLNIKFLYYYLSQTNIYNFLNSNGGSSTMPAITFGQIGAVKIPIPALAEQNRIVAILEKFDKLVNDLNEGLPAEIDARRKQYEYYRGNLLNFKNTNNG